MNGPTSYSPVLVPALHRIQDQFGYLKPEALEAFSKETGVPQYRLHAVASFFPHFLLTPPKKVVLRVCRDLSCHLAGSHKILRELNALTSDEIAVEGTSCLGRCDRAPAACLLAQGAEHEHYYLGRSSEELRTIVAAALDGCANKIGSRYRSEFSWRRFHGRSLQRRIARLSRRSRSNRGPRCFPECGDETSHRQTGVDFGNGGEISHRRHPADASGFRSRAGYSRCRAGLANGKRLGERTDVRRLVRHASRSNSAMPICAG